MEDTIIEQNKKFRKFRRTAADIVTPGNAYSDEVKRRRRVQSVCYSRNQKMSFDAIDIFTNAIALGHYPETAVHATGLSYSTFVRWLKIGEADARKIIRMEEEGIEIHESDYSMGLELYYAYNKALFTAQDAGLSVLNEAAKAGDWKAAAWILERRNSKEWGKKSEHKIEGEITHKQVTKILLVPKLAETSEEWDQAVQNENKGKLEYVQQKSVESTKLSDVIIEGELT